MWRFVLPFCILLRVYSSTSPTCDYIFKLDCGTFQNDPQCGTDGNTYFTSCSFAKSHCNDPHIHHAHTGPCTTHHTPSIFQHGYELVLEVFCMDVKTVSCGTKENKLCANNGKTYFNPCTFEKGRCANESLHIQHEGAC